MGKIKTSTPQKEINIGKNTTSSSEMKIIFYSPNTTHEWFRFKKSFEVSKMSCRTWNKIPFQIDFFPHYIDLRVIAFAVFVRQKY